MLSVPCCLRWQLGVGPSPQPTHHVIDYRIFIYLNYFILFFILSLARFLSQIMTQLIPYINIIKLDSHLNLLQVLKLKERLSEADKEIQRLSQLPAETVPSNSTSSSPSVDTMAVAGQPFLGEFEIMDTYTDIFNTATFYYAHAGMDWISQYM